MLARLAPTPLVFLAALACACQRRGGDGVDRHDVTAWVGAARRAAIADLDGDGRPEVVVADAQKLRVHDAGGRALASAPAEGAIQILTAADLDGDRRAEIVAGWGRADPRSSDPGLLAIDRLEGGALAEQVVARVAGERAEVSAALALPAAAGAPAALLAGAFTDKHMVRIARYARGADEWTDAGEIASLRMATSLVRGDVDGDGQPDLVVGRVYGDDPHSNGDAFLLRPDGARVPIPTTRGVRAIALADTDGDGRLEIFLGDGWDRDYGKVARGLLHRVTWDGGAFRAELIEDPPRQFAIWRILPVDLDGDGHPEIVTLGSSAVRAYRRDGTRWRTLTLAGEVLDIAAGPLDATPGDDLLLVGKRSEILDLARARWR